MLVLGGAMIAARALRAEKAMPVIGYLNSSAPGPSAPFVAAFHQGLSENGYVEDQNVLIEYRWAEGRYDRLPALAADLVNRRVAVIASTGGPDVVEAAVDRSDRLPGQRQRPEEGRRQHQPQPAERQCHRRCDVCHRFALEVPAVSRRAGSERQADR